MRLPPGLSYFGGRAYVLDHRWRPCGDGFPPEAFPYAFVERTVSSAPPVIMVHGFRYDPRFAGRNNPHSTTFAHWRRNILDGRDAFGFGWYSAPGGWRLPESVIRAWLSGRWNTYRHAWDLAQEAGDALAVLIACMRRPVDILCHSLGSRVVLRAFETDSRLPVRRVVLLNGAELVRTALPIASRASHVSFCNLVVRSDDVLQKLGALFAPGDLYAPTIGQAGLGALAPSNWLDIALDDPEVRAWAWNHGWPDVRGDNPTGYWDHWDTHKHPGNWGLLRGMLDGWESRLPGVVLRISPIWLRNRCIA